MKKIKNLDKNKEIREYYVLSKYNLKRVSLIFQNKI